ncbi:MAG: glycosyltransferase family 4 protein [Sideroxydans sp.]
MQLAQSGVKNLLGVRIARISTVPFFVVTQLKSQLAGLGKEGAQVLVISSDGLELAALNDLLGVHCVPIDIPRSIAPMRDFVGLVKLFFLLKRERIQIVHSTTPKAGLLSAIAAFLAGVPIRLHTFTGQPWVNMRGLKGWLARNSDKLIGRLNTLCYADSHSQKDFLIQQKIITAKKIAVIGAGSLAGVDVQRFNREKFSLRQCEELRASLGITAEAPLLLFLGRITVDKGLRELLESFSNLKASGSQAHLLLVGPIDTTSGVAGLISLQDIERIVDTHWVDYTDSPEAYLAIADVLCLPSYREGFGTVVIEAAAMGVPTVGTSIYGLTDAVVQGETGLLVATQNVPELTQALEKILNDSHLRISMGAAAKLRVQQMFDANKVNQQLIDEYLVLLQNRNKEAERVSLK